MIIDELLELEHQGWQSLSDGTGAAFYGRLMTPDGVMILAGGAALDRDAVVASLADAPPWSEYSLGDERVLTLGDDHAVLLYTGSASRGDGARFVAEMASTYVRRADEWRLALYQQTPLTTA